MPSHRGRAKVAEGAEDKDGDSDRVRDRGGRRGVGPRGLRRVGALVPRLSGEAGPPRPTPHALPRSESHRD